MTMKSSLSDPLPFQLRLTEASYDFHQQIISNGFWNHAGDNPSILQEKLMLAVGELAEASEELRKSADPQHIYFREDGKPEGFGFELADAIIRILDLAAFAGLDIGAMVVEKDSFNNTRPYMHGKLA